MRSVVPELMCPVCFGGPESVMHALVRCEFSQVVWFAGHMSIRVDAIQEDDFSSFILALLYGADDLTVEWCFGALYAIWEARNKNVFEGKFSRVMAVVD